MRHAGKVKMAAAAVETETLAIKAMFSMGKRGRAQIRAAALCLALCFTLGAAFSGSAWAEDTDVGIVDGSGATTEGLSSSISCKKNEIPYFDYLMTLEIRRADWECFKAIYSPPASGSFSHNVSDSLCLQDPAGSFGLMDWNTISFYADFYLYELKPLPRSIAWHGLCNILEALALSYETVVREKRISIENMARQRLENPSPEGMVEFSGAELQNISERYRDVELCFTVVVQNLQAARAENYARLPLNIRQVLNVQDRSETAFSVEEAAFWRRTEQRRLAIAEQLDRILVQPGEIEDYLVILTSRQDDHQNINDTLLTVETCARAAGAQLAVNRNLPDKFRDMVNDTIKNTVSKYLKEKVDTLDFVSKRLAEDPEFENYAKGSPEREYKEMRWPYDLEDAEMHRQACDFVRELKGYIDAYGGK